MWLRKFGQIDNWLSCLTAAILPRIRSEHDEANTPDTQPRLQGKGRATGETRLTAPSEVWNPAPTAADNGIRDDSPEVINIDSKMELIATFCSTSA